MLIPASYLQALFLLLFSMFCWGSWANALKLMRGCRFELFYLDYVFGTTLASVVLAFTAGSLGNSGLPFLADLSHAAGVSLMYAFLGGVAFNVANILLTASIEIAGLAVAFPVGVGLSIVIGVILNYWITPKNDPLLLFGGVGLLLAAIVIDGIAFHLHAGGGARKSTRRGIVLCILSGIGLGLFYPLVAKSIALAGHPGPYSVSVTFMLGMLASNMIVNTLVMWKPITGQKPLSFRHYLAMPARWHLFGLIMGGGIWGCGTVFNFVVSSSGLIGPATSFALGDGATMVSAVWGIAVWREFQGASHRVHLLIVWMFVFFVAGLSAIAISPVVALR